MAKKKLIMIKQDLLKGSGRASLKRYTFLTAHHKNVENLIALFLFYVLSVSEKIIP